MVRQPYTLQSVPAPSFLYIVEKFNLIVDIKMKDIKVKHSQVTSTVISRCTMHMYAMGIFSFFSVLYLINEINIFVVFSRVKLYSVPINNVLKYS